MAEARPGPITRGFLFADLRGYTAYLERHGAVAAAELLARFREIVRAAVVSHDGAEIRTEGDSFYVAFPSASAAVACALEIVRAAAAPDHGDPIHPGIGIHAGEAVETPEGPVGTAVNIAARLCAIAGPGEVLVSDTVRSLTRSVVAATFLPAGRRSLKGIGDRVVVYRAVAVGTAPARRANRRPLGVAAVGLAAVAALSLVAVARVFDASLAGTAGPSASGASSSLPSPASTPRPPGYQETSRFAVPLSLVLGNGWLRDNSERADLVSFIHRGPPSGSFDVLIAQAAFDPPCPESTPVGLGPTPDDLVNWLAARPWLDHGDIVPHNLGPYLGRAVTLGVPSPATWTCPAATSPGAATIFRLGGSNPEAIGGTWTLPLGASVRVVAVDAGGQTVTFVLGGWNDTEDFLSYAVPLLQSVRFKDP